MTCCHWLKMMNKMTNHVYLIFKNLVELENVCYTNLITSNYHCRALRNVDDQISVYNGNCDILYYFYSVFLCSICPDTIRMGTGSTI